MSNPRTRSGFASSRRIDHAHSEPSSANGTLNQKTQCQDTLTSAPPSTGPITRPTAATIVLVPIASPSSSFGNASVTIAAELANRNAAATPCAIRHTISSVPPPANPAPSDASPNSAKPAHVGLLAAEQIRQPAGEQHQHGRGDHVGEDHPHQQQDAHAERLLEVGQRDDQGAGVDRREQHPEARAREGPPLVVLMLGVHAEAAA